VGKLIILVHLRKNAPPPIKRKDTIPKCKFMSADLQENFKQQVSLWSGNPGSLGKVLESNMVLNSRE